MSFVTLSWRWRNRRKKKSSERVKFTGAKECRDGELAETWCLSTEEFVANIIQFLFFSGAILLYSKIVVQVSQVKQNIPTFVIIKYPTVLHKICYAI